ncbi:uncharacterized protein RAG0_12697 [Rhynchosporium agropyri]|uniref:ATP-grasp domain-containing protein n=1 Tax=Rhynchosporium agropyri TaxID=914238 RepID=A0A1E1L9I3_9HELO|nr:uncharacterized protein RAG0_12697 [Rhynchosporium agropyri]
MPLTAKSPAYMHFLQNVLLISLAALWAPLCTLIGFSSWIISPYTKTAQKVDQQRQLRQSSASRSQRTVLVTGVGMSKGLFIARAFYQAGYTVVGADFEPFFIPVCGRFSKALKTFHRLSKPSDAVGTAAYIDSLVDVIEKEKVDLWVSCSGVASALEDGKAAEAVEKLTSCRVVQFGVEMTGLLHEKHSFIDNTAKIGLNTPDTHLITSVEEGLALLHPKSEKSDKTFIMKSVGMDDSIRADMSLLPFSHVEKTRAHLSNIRPSKTRPFVLQQFINGPEYCTHSIVVRGRVLAFTCCPSAELLMHYKALSPSDDMFKAMLKYTQIYAEKMGTQMTGHFSIDFLLDRDGNEEDLMKKIYPIECNPRAHTAVILFAEQSMEMADSYFEVAKDEIAWKTGSQLVTTTSSTGYYWVGHDLVTRLLLPLVAFLTLQTQFSDLKRGWMEFFDHVLYWRDGTYEIWDPWPFWALYCIYWPCIFLARSYTGKKWSRCNVSTTKVFDC